MPRPQLLQIPGGRGLWSYFGSRNGTGLYGDNGKEMETTSIYRGYRRIVEKKGNYHLGFIGF